MNRGVVLTGLGVAGAYGCAADLAQALATGTPPAATAVDRRAGYHRPEGARTAMLTRLDGLSAWIGPAEARRMSPPSRLAVAALRMALADAGLPARGRWEGEAEARVAVVLATAFGPSSFSEALLRQVLREGPESASPYLFTESVANAPAAQIAIATGAKGPNLTICQREAGALLALGRAAALVAAGRVRLALAGAVDEISPLLHAILDRFGALARDEVARPFDRRRDGFVAADGAAVLVVESEDDARRRGARPLARVRAWGSAFDPGAPPAGWGKDDRGLAATLAGGLARAGLAPGGLDRIVAGAAGTRRGDRLEARLLARLWDGAALPPVLAPKAVTGEYGGGFLAAAVQAASGAPFGPAAGFADPDPDLGLAPHDGRPLPPPGAVLATSLAAGGAAAWVVLERP